MLPLPSTPTLTSICCLGAVWLLDEAKCSEIGLSKKRVISLSPNKEVADKSPPALASHTVIRAVTTPNNLLNTANAPDAAVVTPPTAAEAPLAELDSKPKP